MKLFFTTFLLLVMGLSIMAQGEKSTGYFDDFNNVVLDAGWTENSQYLLSATGTSMEIEIDKTQPWRSFFLDLGLTHDFSANPYVNLKAHGTVPFILHVYFVDANGNNVISAAKLHKTGDYVNLFFDLTPPANSDFDITQVESMLFAMNGAAVSLEGTAWFDDLKVGDQAQKMAFLSGFDDQVLPINSIDNTIFVTDIYNASNLSLTGAEILITNVEISPITDGTATITFDCVADAEGSAYATVALEGANDYTANVFLFEIMVEQNEAPTIHQAADLEIATGAFENITLSGISDGNISEQQQLVISLSSTQTSVVNPSTSDISYSPGSPYAYMQIQALEAGTADITITLDDLSPNDNTTEMTFTVNVYDDFNNPPSIDSPLAQEVFTGATAQTITLTGIGDGDNSDQTLTFDVTPQDIEIIEWAQISYSQGDETAVLEYMPANSGTTFIDIVVTDDGGTEQNNGNGSTTVQLKVEVRQSPITGFTIPLVDLAADMEANLWKIESDGVAQTIEYVSFDGYDEVLKINCLAKNTWTGLWYRNPELDLTEHPYIVCDVYSVDNQIDFHTYLYDNEGNRNAPGAHAQRATITPDSWTTVVLDYRGEGMLEDGDGNRINVARIDSILLNYHDGFDWPFHEYSGVLYIRNIRIGSDAANDIPPLTPDATIDPVANKVLPVNAGMQEIMLTGISDGAGATENITFDIQSSNESLIPIPTIGTLSAEGTATLSFTPGEGTGSSNISITVNADGANSSIISFSVSVIDPDPLLAESIEIDMQTRYQTMKGFGTFSNSENLLDLYVHEMGATAIRIGLIGNQIEPVNDNNDPYVLNREGLNYNALNFDYYRKLKEAGVQTFILTSWSPPAWMKDNLSENYQSAGLETNTDNTSNKLSYHYYEEFAESMVAVVRMFEEEAGITLAGIGLQNEPAFHEPYASAILDLVRFPQLIQVVGERFEMEGITTELFMPEQVFSQDNNSMWQYMDYLRANTDADPYCDVIATHGYGTDGIQPGSPNFSEWESMWNKAQEGDNPKELWMTETFREYNTWDDAIGFAGAIHGALSAGNVSLWTSWAFEGMQVKQGKATPMLYTSANFFRFVKPGAVRLDATSSDEDILVTAWELDDMNDDLFNTEVIVVINKGIEAKSVSISGEGVSVAYQVWQTAENENLKDMGIHAEEPFLLPPLSISTLVEVDYNRKPTIDQVEGFSIPEESEPQQITLTGITDGGDQIPQMISVEVESSQTEVIGNLGITYSSPDQSAVFNYTVLGTEGQTATINVMVQDDGGTPNGASDQTSMSFTITIDSAIDVENPEALSGEIFPNPVHDLLHVRNPEKITSITIFDLSGKMVMQQRKDFGYETTLDTHWMDNGIYFIELTDNKSQNVRYKFVKE